MNSPARISVAIIALAAIFYFGAPHAGFLPSALSGVFNKQPLKTIRLTAHIDELRPHVHNAGDSEIGHSETTQQHYVVPQDLWYISQSTGRLKNAPLEVFHHAEVKIADQKEVAGCDNEPSLVSSSPEAVFMGGKHGRPSGTATFLKKGTPLVFRTFFHNDTGETYHNVEFLIDLHVAYGSKQPEGMRQLKLFYRWLGDNPCAGYFTVPPNAKSFSIESSPANPFSFIEFPEDGEIVKVLAHSHYPDGGKRVTVFHNGKYLLELNTVQAGKNPLAWLNSAVAGEPIREVKKGDVITYKAGYENPRDFTVTDGMARLYIYFLPKSSK